jgi:hypothetical protein
MNNLPRPFKIDPPEELRDALNPPEDPDQLEGPRSPHLIVWTTREGDQIVVQDMTTDHIKNCLTMIQGEREKIKGGYITAAQSRPRKLVRLMGVEIVLRGIELSIPLDPEAADPILTELDDWIEIFKHELKRRKL